MSRFSYFLIFYNIFITLILIFRVDFSQPLFFCGRLKSTLLAQIELENNEYELYHYRDREKREIDFIIQDTNNNIYGIEVKAGSSVTKEQFKHMKWFKENLVKGKFFTGIVLYTGEHVIPFGGNMLAVPMNNLWD